MLGNFGLVTDYLATYYVKKLEPRLLKIYSFGKNFDFTRLFQIL